MLEDFHIFPQYQVEYAKIMSLRRLQQLPSDSINYNHLLIRIIPTCVEEKASVLKLISKYVTLTSQRTSGTY